MLGSRIIFAGLSKIFTQANKDQERGSNHTAYALDQWAETNEYVEKREIRFDSKCKTKTSFYSSPIEDEILLGMGIEPSYDLEKMESQFYDEAMTGEFS